MPVKNTPDNRVRFRRSTLVEMAHCRMPYDHATAAAFTKRPFIPLDDKCAKHLQVGRSDIYMDEHCDLYTYGQRAGRWYLMPLKRKYYDAVLQGTSARMTIRLSA